MAATLVYLDSMLSVLIFLSFHSLGVCALHFTGFNSIIIFSIITEIIARFEQNVYSVNESSAQFEVCVLVEGMRSNLTLLVLSQSNTAEGILFITL